MKQKLYVISGLGADFTVLEKIQFPEQYEVVFIDWLIPTPNESFDRYVHRMAEKIDDTQPFSLLGYSFGGIMVQEIATFKSPEKIIILGSIRNHKEKSALMNWGYRIPMIKKIPTRFFSQNSAAMYFIIRKIFDPKNPTLNQYFRVKDPYYLKWSIEKIIQWKFKTLPHVIQIMGDKDIVFPIEKCKPDFIIKGGTHLFPVTKHKEVSKILAHCLNTQ